MRAVTLSSLILLGTVGCAATRGGNAGLTGTSTTSTSGTGGQPSTGGHGGDTGLGGAFTGSGGGFTGCTAATELVYVFDTESNIWSFDPPSKQFAKVAKADCPTTMTANSMAIDRNLVAWLNYFNDANDGALFAFDLNQKSGCKKIATLSGGFGQVGMGFSTDTAGGSAETLYLDTTNGQQFARLEPSTMTIVPLGNFTNDTHLAGRSAELTGTGDARLFGYFTTYPEVRVAQIDKTTANIVSDHALQGFPPPQDWAFTFWGGDFYLYAAPIPANNDTGNSSVVHYDLAHDVVDLSYVKDVGFQIVGAGVSTCAPTRPTT